MAPLLKGSLHAISESSSPFSPNPTTVVDGYHDPIGYHNSAISEIRLFPADIKSDVLSGTSALGRNLSWKTSVRSPGLALALWGVGAILVYLGLMVMLEFGSMLSRSGGKRSKRATAYGRTGATQTFIFDHTIRRADEKATNVEDDDESANPIKGPIRGPVKRVHVDQSCAQDSRVFHIIIPMRQRRVWKGFVQLINVWRPIKTVKRDPLTVAQARSVDEEDLVPIGLIYEKRQGETLSVKHSDGQKWFYKYPQTPEEVLLIKCFDNRAGAESDPEQQGQGEESSPFGN